MSVLGGYERARHWENTAMLASVDGLKRLFANSFAPVTALRTIGLRFSDAFTPLKVKWAPPFLHSFNQLITPLFLMGDIIFCQTHHTHFLLHTERDDEVCSGLVRFFIHWRLCTRIQSSSLISMTGLCLFVMKVVVAQVLRMMTPPQNIWCVCAWERCDHHHRVVFEWSKHNSYWMNGIC